MTQPEAAPEYARYRYRRSRRLRSVRRYLAYLAVRGLMAVANRLPLSALQWLGRGVGRLGQRLQPQLAGVCDYQLGLALPELPKAERSALVRECFAQMGMTACEVMVMPRLRQEAGDWLRIEGAQDLLDAHAEGRGVVVVTAHAANWELLSIAVERLQVTTYAIARQLSNPWLDRVVNENRTNPYLIPIPRGSAGAPRQLLSCLRAGHALILVIDQDTKAQGVYAKFFGIPASTPRVAATLALRRNCPAVTMFDTRQPDGRHVIRIQRVAVPETVHAATDPEAALTQVFNDHIEAHVREYPAQWCWHHRRWKTRPTPPAEPAQ